LVVSAQAGTHRRGSHCIDRPAVTGPGTQSLRVPGIKSGQALGRDDEVRNVRRHCGISVMVRITLEVGRELTVGSLFSFCTISSYSASVCSGAFGTMCTIL